MQRFVTAVVKHETNTFSPVPTPLSAFGRYAPQHGPVSGEAALDAYRGTATPVGAFIDLARERGASLAFPIAANATPGGCPEDSIIELAAEKIIAAVREGCDALFLDLHGGMVTPGFDDPEGELLRRIRTVVADLPIAVSFDFHTNLSRLTMDNASVITGYRTYPHVDQYETGRRAGTTLLRSLDGKVRPRMVWHSLPILSHLNRQTPSRQPMKDIMDRAIAAEASGEVLNASVLGCFPLADIPFVGMHAIVVTDDDAAAGVALLNELMHMAWDRRAEFVYETEPVAASIARARTLGEGPILLADHGDVAGSGGSTDVMDVLEETMRQGLDDACAGPFWDPAAVARMVEAGAGANVSLAVGGHTDFPAIGLRGKPLALSRAGEAHHRRQVRGDRAHGDGHPAGPGALRGARHRQGRDPLQRGPPRALRRRLLHPRRHRSREEALHPDQVAAAFPRRLRAHHPPRGDGLGSRHHLVGLLDLSLETGAAADLPPGCGRAGEPAGACRGVRVSAASGRALALAADGAERSVECLRDLVRVPSLTGEEGAAQAHLCEHLRCLGAHTEVLPVDMRALFERFPDVAQYPTHWQHDLILPYEQLPSFEALERSGLEDVLNYRDRPNVVATFRGTGGGRSLILNGHIDTVTVEPREAWTRDPFSGAIEDGLMYGRGTSDMKGGLMAAVMAMTYLREAGVDLAGDVIVQSVVNEEHAGNGTLDLVRRGYRADAAIVLEPTNNRIAVSHPGGLYWEVTVPGIVRSPGARWDGERMDGVSAIEKLPGIIDALLAVERGYNAVPNDDPMEAGRAPFALTIGKVSGGHYETATAGEATLRGGGYFSPVVGDVRDVMGRFRSAIRGANEADDFLRENPARLAFLHHDDSTRQSPQIPVAMHAGEVVGHRGGLAKPCAGPFACDMRHLVNQGGSRPSSSDRAPSPRRTSPTSTSSSMNTWSASGT